MDAMVAENKIVMSWLSGHRTDLPDPSHTPVKSMLIVDGKIFLKTERKGEFDRSGVEDITERYKSLDCC